ncbi:hypothetical protein QTP70_026963 [Hemibagrus guttatus]|uniref:TASOR pseudo-PARP domain-containing protein n=1 Tax=Hemibagrus guttatus TaxID=175788 RepID=A0AAE0QJI4_9TELE|nr:hypothetical protein QTP70_026963 [Hemibagrus guttatus]
MEVRGRKGSVELSTTNSSKPVGTVALRNFTIPRKKRVSGQVLLEPCPEDSRDYTLIQSKLKESRLDMRKEHANAWLWKDVKLVHNDGFLKEFSEKRSEMRTKGRHGREMEERFCFLLASSEATNEIYQFGLRTGSQDQYSLGKPSHGVYLFKHVDVALKHATASTCNGKNLIIFKVLFGKVKKVTPSLEWNRTVDPMVGFDCHMAKDAVSYRDSVSQQVLGSLVFLFDYNQNQELDKRPRQCLPYAVVSFAPAISAAAPTSISPPVSPNKAPASFMHGPLEHLKGCTVAKRTGKGENATVTFKRFATQGCPGVEYQPQTPTAEANGVDASPFQYNDLHTTPPFILHQAYMPYYNTTDYFNLSLPCYDSDISWQSYSDTPTFPSNVYNLNTASVYGVLVDSERNKAALLNTDNDELNQKICRPKENHVQEKERDPPPDSQTEPQDGAAMINLGDCLENLKNTHDIVTAFIETPADRLPEACLAHVNKTDQSPQPMDIVKSTPPMQVNASRIPSAGGSTERTQTALIQMEDGTKETHQPSSRRAMLPCPRSNFGDGVTPLIQPNLATQPGSSPHYTDFTQRSNALHWRIPRNSAWDWSSPDAIQSPSYSEIRAVLLSKRQPTGHTKPRTTSLTDLQNPAVRQQQLSQPLIVKPKPIERSKAKQTISAPQHLELLKEQTNEFSMPVLPAFPFPSFSPDAPSVIPLPLPPLPFSSTSNQVALHNNPTPISYPFFVFNGQTYSTTGSSVPVTAIHTETQYLPHPV